MGHPKKKWGQHFLRNRSAVEKIVAAVEPREDEIVLEIGPGEGVLTAGLVGLGRPVVALEIDPLLASRLRERFGEAVAVRNEDAVDAALPGVPFRAVGNLPYNSGTPILRRVIADPNCRRAVFMLQKEVADRLVAAPDSDPYGFLTLYRQLYADARIVLKLGPKSFHPRPKVDSAVVVLDPKERDYQSDPAALLDLISASFRMRRKKLVNNLIAWRDLERGEIVEAMGKAGIDPNARAETLDLHAFDRLQLAIRTTRRSSAS
ncbi:MAG TPA: 16S rRNA (adenine(1518)-N(6)/adenine(1519)-N(6))-dimethyltransferase RsmA [Thermoanaerobaculia bacterium]|nr:16S rRNA (adenine(1518)-N(6)/adenine(1519)-N(6))-dimethyltransferase RsmA [Thermoanaerobaculia bacterium]